MGGASIHWESIYEVHVAQLRFCLQSGPDSLGLAPSNTRRYETRTGSLIDLFLSNSLRTKDIASLLAVESGIASMENVCRVVVQWSNPSHILKLLLHVCKGRALFASIRSVSV